MHEQYSIINWIRFFYETENKYNLITSTTLSIRNLNKVGNTFFIHVETYVDKTKGKF